MPELSPALEAAIAASEAEEACQPCASSAGLCVWHAQHDREIMPLPTPDPLSYLAVSGRFELHKHEDLPLSPAGQRARDRKARKRQRAEVRLRRALAGEFTRSRPSTGAVNGAA